MTVIFLYYNILVNNKPIIENYGPVIEGPVIEM